MKRNLALIFLVISASAAAGSDGFKRNPIIDVLNYSFSVSLSDTSDIIYGKTVITLSFKCEATSMEFDLKNIRPDGKGMVIDSVAFSGCSVKWTHSGDKITIIPAIPVNKENDRKLRIIYHGIPADGLIISNNKFRSRTFFSDHWPNRASNYLPCIDHPYDKATVEFIITSPSHYEVVSNGSMAEESHLAGNTKITRWREDVPLPVKVMAFGAAEFDVQLAGNPVNVPVLSYVFTGNREEGFFDYSAAVKPVEFFSRLIGPYPFEKLANVQSKTIFGGLENAGCIFYAENSVTGKGKAERLLAHEISHQWFGNSVTENDWNHIWLSEGFATYLTAYYVEMNFGRDSFTDVMKSARERVIKYFLRSPRPVIDTTITDYMKLLNANSYEKGSWVLHMLRYELGDESFWRGIRLFYERYKTRNVLTSDFISVMEEVSGKELDTFFRQWLYTAGQPDLKITTRSSGSMGMKEVTIEQQQKDLFAFPFQLLIISREGLIQEKVRISERITKIPVRAGKIIDIIPDPEVNLLFRQIKD